jgi:putative flippase GtrA
MTASGQLASLRIFFVTRVVRETVIFLAIGGISAVVYTVFAAFLTRICGLRPSLAIVAALTVLIPPTYLAQRKLTFRSTRNHRAAFPRYIGTQIAGNALALVGSEMFSTIVQDWPWIAFSAVAADVAATNYALLKPWTFQRAA